MNRTFNSKICGLPFLTQTLILLSFSTCAWSTDYAPTLDASLGSDGIGIGIEKPLSDQWSISIRASSLSFDGDYEADDLDYDAEISQHAISTLINWYPFSGGLKATFGITSLQGDYILEASGEDSYEIGNETYNGNITLKSSVNISRVNPYLGLGWRTRHSNSGIGLGFDLGAIWLHKLDLNMTATGSATDTLGNTVNISADNNFLQDLQAEEDELEADIKDFIFPWVTVGRVYISYKF